MCSSRLPLTPEQLCIVVSQDPNNDFCPSAGFSIEYILGACHNLITLTTKASDSSQNPKDARCQFSHLSVQEYLEEHRLPKSDCHDLAAEVAMRYYIKAGGQLKANDVWSAPFTRVDYHLDWGNPGWSQRKLKLFAEFAGDPFNGSLAYQVWSEAGRTWKEP
jgi:hypothetical protein